MEQMPALLDDRFEESRSGLSRELIVSQANQLIESTHRLTLNEKRLTLVAAALIDSRKPLPDKGTVTITAQDFADAFGIESRGHTYEALRDAAKGLFERKITRIEKGPKNSFVERDVRWVWMSEYREDEGSVTLGFSPAIAPYLTLLSKEFTSYKLRYVGNLSSFYSVRFYELCMQFKKTGERRVTLEKLRTILDLGEKYKDVKNLRVRVIDPSMEDINEHTDLSVSYEPMRKGRRIVGFSFNIDAMEQRELPL
jgi:plasmid replication initiation protein